MPWWLVPPSRDVLPRIRSVQCSMRSTGRPRPIPGFGSTRRGTRSTAGTSCGGRGSSDHLSTEACGGHDRHRFVLSGRDDVGSCPRGCRRLVWHATLDLACPSPTRALSVSGVAAGSNQHSADHAQTSRAQARWLHSGEPRWIMGSIEGAPYVGPLWESSPDGSCGTRLSGHRLPTCGVPGRGSVSGTPALSAAV